MNLTRCNHGHFYDMDKFESCPDLLEVQQEQQSHILAMQEM